MEHPVDALEETEFTYWAGMAASMLRQNGHAVIHLEPGDMTRYSIILAYPLTMQADGTMTINERPLWMCTSFGTMYQVNLEAGHKHWDYVNDKWVQDGNQWTARVLTRFLNALVDAMAVADA